MKSCRQAAPATASGATLDNAMTRKLLCPDDAAAQCRSIVTTVSVYCT